MSEETIQTVRSALVRYIDTPVLGDGLGDALHEMAAEARRAEMLPEQLLVVLKDIWYSLPSVRALKEPAEQIRLLQRVVTLCIREYFAD